MVALKPAKVVRMAGGKALLARRLGPPVNEYTINIWVRNGYIPEGYRPAVAKLIDCKLEQLQPPEPEEKGPKHRGVARAYAGMLHAVGMRPRKAANLHKVEVGQVDRWLSGHDQVPVSAILDVYAYASGEVRRQTSLTVDEAMKMTGLSQSALCRFIGVSKGLATRWRKAGKIPVKYAKLVVESARKGNWDE